MHNKIKYLVYLSIPFFTLLFVLFTLINTYKENKIKTILNTHTNKIETFYNILSYNQEKTADIIFKETVQNKELLDILEDANGAFKNKESNKIDNLRKKAQKILAKNYKRYKEQGILQYHFVFPNNKVFLRMHKPSKYGDDLTKVRSDFDYTNKNLQIVRGFAQGRTSHAFRNVYPIFKEDKHLISVEISFSSELLQNYFTNISKLHTHFLVRKDIFKSHAWERNDLILKYHQSSENENYMITMTSDHSKEKCIYENKIRIKDNKALIDSQIIKKDKFSVYTLFEEKARVTSFFPILHNISKEPVAWIVSYTKESLIDETLQTSLIMYILVVILLFIIFAFIYFLLNQKETLNTLVKDKTKHLKKLNANLRESEHKLLLTNESLEYKIAGEVDKNRQKDKMLFEQTKMAALGEMIGNIAHQWRQPLSVISTSVTGMQVQNEMDILTKKEIDSLSKEINKNAQYLSKTIDDFTNFIKGNSQKENIIVDDMINSFLNLIETSRKKHEIDIITSNNSNDEIHLLKNELSQCLINLFNNSKDAFKDNNIQDKYILLESTIINDTLEIRFQDNAGGIKEDILNKIFEPYFTTKHQSLGTGLGLNMTYRLIVEGMNGLISVYNEKFTHKNDTFYGALFIISLPCKKD